MGLSQVDGHRDRSWSPWVWKKGQDSFSLCFFQSVLLPFFPFCSTGGTDCVWCLRPQRSWASPTSALPCGSRQHSFKRGLVCGTPTETEVLVGKGQSGDRWGREKWCYGFRGDLFADFRALFSACWLHASAEEAVDSLMLGSWLDFCA